MVGNLAGYIVKMNISFTYVNIFSCTITLYIFWEKKRRKKKVAEKKLNEIKYLYRPIALKTANPSEAKINEIDTFVWSVLSQANLN